MTFIDWILLGVVIWIAAAGLAVVFFIGAHYRRTGDRNAPRREWDSPR